MNLSYDYDDCNDSCSINELEALSAATPSIIKDHCAVGAYDVDGKRLGIDLCMAEAELRTHKAVSKFR